MEESIKGIEILPPPTGLPAAGSDAKKLSRRRLRVFIGTFLFCLIAGLIWDFQRPALYRASASLLTVAPPEANQRSDEADIQHVAIQRQLLLSRPVLEQVVAELGNRDPGIEPVSVDRLRTMLQVLPVPETNLVELRAEGGDPLFLSLAVNTWIETYLHRRAKEVAELEARTTDLLHEQYQSLGQKIEQKRAALHRFREENQILSTARDENQVLARLKGLNDSLNAANEEKIKARARLNAVEAAIARGETVVPEQEKRSYVELVRRAQELREQVAELERRYTDEYIQRSPALKVIPEKLARLEQKLQKARRSGQDHVLATARQEYAAANQTVVDLERQLGALKRQASEFTARFSEYEAMQEDLAGLELAHRELEERLVKVEISNRQKYPQVQVVEWAYPPQRPIWPNYLRDAGIVAGVSLLVALLMVWLVDFLRPLQRGPAQTTMGIAIYPADAVLEQHEREQAALERGEGHQALPAAGPGELSRAEVATLLENADPVARQLILLLMSGLTVREILDLEETDLDLAGGEIRVGNPRRSIRLPADTRNWFEQDGKPWLAWKQIAPFDEQELQARLQLAALDTGLEKVAVSGELLRNTYLLYLVRKGLRITELEKIAGSMSARRLLELGRDSPAGTSRTLSEVDPVYPLFAGQG